MSEYIEREAALLEIEEWADTFCECDYVWPHVIKSIRKLPAADVRPVVRGKWSIHEIYKHEMSYGVTAYEPVYKCSACGSLMESYLRFDEPIMPEDADFPRFCPNCGADMREES